MQFCWPLKVHLQGIKDFKSQLNKGKKIEGKEDVFELFSEKENVIYKIRVKYDIEEFVKGFDTPGKSQNPKHSGAQVQSLDPNGFPPKDK